MCSEIKYNTIHCSIIRSNKNKEMKLRGNLLNKLWYSPVLEYYIVIKDNVLEGY